MDTKERKLSTKGGRSASRTGTKTKTASGSRSASTRKTASQPRKPSEGQKTTASSPKTAKQRVGTAQRRPSVSENPSAGRTRVSTQTRRRPPARRKERRSIAQDVVYLPPKPFSRNRLLLRLASVVAVVVALVLGISVFFKVESVYISGNEKYSAEAILEASGIQTGDNLLTFSRAKAGGRIIANLPFVEKVRFGIKLPGTVNIEITEVEVGYAAADVDGNWWLISSAGKVLEKLSGGANTGYTNILGIALDMPAVGNHAVAQEQPQQTDEAGNPIPVTVTGEKRLRTALNILQYLEQNGIIGEAASVDVSQLGSIQMEYGRRYQIQLGDDTQLAYKISVLKAAIAKVAKEYPYSIGTLDVSDPGNIRFNQDKS